MFLLLVSNTTASIVDTRDGQARDLATAKETGSLEYQLERTPFAGLAETTQALLGLTGGMGQSPTSTRPSVVDALALVQTAVYRYPRRTDAPNGLRGEWLPPAPADIEMQLAGHVDFSPAVLADRLRKRVQVQRIDEDLFDAQHVREDADDLWASLSPEAVAERAEQLRLRLHEANDRELYARLLERFAAAIEASGAESPEDEEQLMQQLDLVLVRRPTLLREAYRRLRLDQVRDIDVALPAELQSAQPLPAANRALYGVFPDGLNPDELAVANLLDGSRHVRWWHRNPSKTTADMPAVGLYRWDDGEGFYPDFVVCLEGRAGAGIALLEVKGPHLRGLDSEVDKAGAQHRDYGAVFMVGHRRGERDFHFLRALGSRLEEESAFSVERLRFP